MPCRPCPVNSRSIVPVVAGDAGARLDGRHDDAVIHHLDLDDVRGALHRPRHDLGVALAQVESEIAGRHVPDRGRAGGERRRTVDDGRQRLVLDLDQLGRLVRDLRAVGDDEGHRIADMAHTAQGQRRARRHDQRLHRCHAGQRTKSVGREIGRGINAAHPGKRRGRQNVDPPDQRMSMRRAQHVAMQAGRDVDVVDVAAAADEEP
jgi:hypothetical protein